MYVTFWDWLFTPRVMVLTSVGVVACRIPIYCGVVFYWVASLQSVNHSPVEGHVGCFQICIYITLYFISFILQIKLYEHSPGVCVCVWSSIAGSYGKCMFKLIRNCVTVFHSGCTSLLCPTPAMCESSSYFLWNLVWSMCVYVCIAILILVSHFVINLH